LRLNNFKIGLEILKGLGLIGIGHEPRTDSATTTRPRRLTAAPVKLQPGGPHMDLHHPFVKEFPAHRETIRSLKLADGQFREAFEEYHKLDDEICRIEDDVEFASDQQIDELKFKRAKLKDQLYRAVQRHEAALVH
jgi:uncharacterized protein YdcH (DUF465 family)